MRVLIVGAIVLLAVPTSLAAQLVEVHAGVRVSDRVAVEVHYGSPRYQPGVFVAAPVPPRYAYRRAAARRNFESHRRAMRAYERALRKFEHEHQKAHRFGIPHVHLRGGIQYLDYGRGLKYRDPYRPYR